MKNDTQIQQDVLELVRVYLGLPQSTRQYGFDRDALTECPSQQIGHVGHQTAHIQGFRIERLRTPMRRDHEIFPGMFGRDEFENARLVAGDFKQCGANPIGRVSSARTCSG